MRVLALVIVGALALSVCGFRAVGAQADSSAMPPYDGAMSFPTIAGLADPEEFSWEVVLHDGQELKAIDDQRAGIFYTEGHYLGLEISAEAAHAANGSAVPTTLSVSGANIITLTVHHRAGDPANGGALFDYPITAGQGWEGGYQTFIVAGPPAEKGPDGAGGESVTLSKVRKRRGQIGGHPSTRLTPPDQGRQTTPALVIGRGRLFGGPVEIAGAGWSAPNYFEAPGGGQFCVWIEFLAERSTSSMCGPVAQTASGNKAIHIESFREGMVNNSPREVELTGSLAPDVASIRVSFARQGAPRVFQTKALVAHIRGELQKSLKQPGPFGYFVIKVRGRFVAKSLSIRAFDKAGHFVGASQGISSESLP